MLNKMIGKEERKTFFECIIWLLLPRLKSESNWKLLEWNYWTEQLNKNTLKILYWTTLLYCSFTTFSQFKFCCFFCSIDSFFVIVSSTWRATPWRNAEKNIILNKNEEKKGSRNSGRVERITRWGKYNIALEHQNKEPFSNRNESSECKESSSHVQFCLVYVNICISMCMLWWQFMFYLFLFFSPT